MWNITGVNRPGLLHEPLLILEKACQEVGRDSARLEKTVQIRFAKPEIAPPPGWMKTYLSGSTEQVAATFKQFEEIGISHLMIQVGPEGLPTIPFLANAVDLYRQYQNFTKESEKKIL